MKKKIKRLILRRGFEFSIYAILAILIFNGILILRYRQIIKENITLKEDLREISTRNNEITANLNRADMALRGYLLVPQETMLDPFEQAAIDLPRNLERVETLAGKHGYDISKMQLGKKTLLEYMDLVQQMVNMAKTGNSAQALEILETDPGYEAWKTYNPMQVGIASYVNELNAEANQEYDAIIRNTRISQIIILLLSVPFLIAIARRLRKSQINRKKLFYNLNENQKKYLFDDRKENGAEVNELTVIDGLVQNLKKASHFINNITEGNYDVSWEGLDEETQKYNATTLSGELTKMRDQMIKVKKEDEKKLWVTEGLSKFGEIIRNYQSNLNALSDHLVSELVKYLGARQGGMFILNDENEHNQYLELSGCYAYERKKYLEKEIQVGDGLVGQCFLEKEHIYLENVPQDYVTITSGLGETNPSALLLVPLKNESAVVGVLEIASLKTFEDYQLDFINQLSESIASAIQNVKTNENTNELLEKTQQQAEEMRAQEEEMRQNMEELQATQESLNRESKEKEKVQHEIERTKNFLQQVINALPDPIFVKDQDHRFVILNDAVCEFNGWNRDEVLGKTDFDFFAKNEAQVMYDNEEDLLKTKKDVEVEMEATRSGKKTYVIDKKRVIEDDEGKRFIVGINIDISQLKKTERDLAKEKYLLDAMLDNMPDSIYFKDEKSRFIRVSKSLATVFGFSQSDEIIGKTDFDFQDEEHAQQAFDDEMEIIKTEKPVIDVVEKETFEDGNVRWVSTTKLPLRNLENKVVGTFGISRDITKIKNMEIEYQEKLNEAQQELEEKNKEIKQLRAK